MYKLLVLDDEPLVRRGIKAFIDKEALNISDILEAANGEEGLMLFDKYNPDIILADINMPKMNGLDFTKAIKEKNALVKIALITGYDYFDYAVTALKMGVDDYILKPVSKNDIHLLLKGLVEKLDQLRVEDELKKTNSMIKIQHDDNSYKELILKEIERQLMNCQFSLTDLADYVGLSVGYLSTLFKRLFGDSFQNYLLNQRLQRAKILLLTTELKNYEIAEQVGFDDANYFNTRFKKAFGCPPKQYKDKVSDRHETS